MFFKKEAFKQIESSPVEIIQTFVATYYPGLSLHSKMLEQLLWLQNNFTSTSQSTYTKSIRKA